MSETYVLVVVRLKGYELMAVASTKRMEEEWRALRKEKGVASISVSDKNGTLLRQFIRLGLPGVEYHKD